MKKGRRRGVDDAYETVCTVALEPPPLADPSPAPPTGATSIVRPPALARGLTSFLGRHPSRRPYRARPGRTDDDR